MGKGRKVRRVANPEIQQVLGVLKRLQRRLLAGQNIPFLIATIEPLRVPGQPEPVANPVIASLGLMDPRVKHLRIKLIDHLVEAGLLKAQEKPEEASELEDNLEG